MGISIGGNPLKNLGWEATVFLMNQSRGGAKQFLCLQELLGPTNAQHSEFAFSINFVVLSVLILLKLTY